MSVDLDDDIAACRARIGQLLPGGFRLETLIGVGGMAGVYSAKPPNGPNVAVKILHAHVAFSREMRARFEQEARAVQRLNHPGTVHVIDVNATEDGAPFMVMELLVGESLGQRAHRLGRVDEEELIGYMHELLGILAAAHEAGIIHRDIKPDNLFVSRTGHLKVLDFGIARMREGASVRTRTGAMLGTTAYMAPEQVRAQEIDGRTDVFAVGATMFRLLAKRKIHEAESEAELLMKMGGMQAPPLRQVAPRVSRHLAYVVDCALSFSRERRYPSAAAMRDDLERVRSGQEPTIAIKFRRLAEQPTGDGSLAPLGTEAAPIAPSGAPPALDPRARSDRPPSVNASAWPASIPPKAAAPTAIEQDQAVQTDRSPTLPPTARRSTVAMVALVMLLLGASLAAGVYFMIRP